LGGPRVRHHRSAGWCRYALLGLVSPPPERLMATAERPPAGDTSSHRYAARPYPSFVFPFTDPERIGAIARLHGLIDAVPSNWPRLLEVGCDSGLNLLTMARRFPHGRFVGIDFDAASIVMARDRARREGVSQVAFEQADIVTWQ